MDVPVVILEYRYHSKDTKEQTQMFDEYLDNSLLIINKCHTDCPIWGNISVSKFFFNVSFDLIKQELEYSNNDKFRKYFSLELSMDPIVEKKKEKYLKIKSLGNI